MTGHSTYPRCRGDIFVGIPTPVVQQSRFAFEGQPWPHYKTSFDKLRSLESVTATEKSFSQRAGNKLRLL